MQSPAWIVGMLTTIPLFWHQFCYRRPQPFWSRPCSFSLSFHSRHPTCYPFSLASFLIHFCLHCCLLESAAIRFSLYSCILGISWDTPLDALLLTRNQLWFLLPHSFIAFLVIYVVFADSNSFTHWALAAVGGVSSPLTPPRLNFFNLQPVASFADSSAASLPLRPVWGRYPVNFNHRSSLY